MNIDEIKDKLNILSCVLNNGTRDKKIKILSVAVNNSDYRDIISSHRGITDFRMYYHGTPSYNSIYSTEPDMNLFAINLKNSNAIPSGHVHFLVEVVD